jgi:hypothetical protein
MEFFITSLGFWVFYLMSEVKTFSAEQQQCAKIKRKASLSGASNAHSGIIVAYKPSRS